MTAEESYGTCPVCNDRTRYWTGACVSGCGYVGPPAEEYDDFAEDADDDELDAYADKP